MSILRMVVNKRTEEHKQEGEANKSLKTFSERVAKLRGEGAMSTSDEPEVALEVVSINISDIEIPPNYLRKSLGNVEALLASIKIYGIQQPLKVVKLKGSKKYRLVFGRRRLKAAELAGLDAVPCIVELITREDRLQMLSLSENMHRTDLNAIEIGDGYQQLMNQNAKFEDLSANLGLPVELIQETVNLLSLPPSVRKDVMNAPDRFSFKILQTLAQAYHQSKVHGKKLLGAIIAEEVTSAKEAEAFLSQI